MALVSRWIMEERSPAERARAKGGGEKKNNDDEHHKGDSSRNRHLEEQTRHLHQEPRGSPRDRRLLKRHSRGKAPHGTPRQARVHRRGHGVHRVLLVWTL